MTVFFVGILVGMVLLGFMLNLAISLIEKDSAKTKREFVLQFFIPLYWVMKELKREYNKLED